MYHHTPKTKGYRMIYTYRTTSAYITIMAGVVIMILQEGARWV